VCVVCGVELVWWRERERETQCVCGVCCGTCRERERERERCMCVLAHIHTYFVNLSEHEDAARELPFFLGAEVGHALRESDCECV
jgi:hypothetical protein